MGLAGLFVLEEAALMARAQLGEGLGFDLTRALSRHAERIADDVEGSRPAIRDAEAEFDDLALAWRKDVERLTDALPEQFASRFLFR